MATDGGAEGDGQWWSMVDNGCGRAGGYGYKAMEIMDTGGYETGGDVGGCAGWGGGGSRLS